MKSDGLKIKVHYLIYLFILDLIKNSNEVFIYVNFLHSTSFPKASLIEFTFQPMLFL